MGLIICCLLRSWENKWKTLLSCHQIPKMKEISGDPARPKECGYYEPRFSPSCYQARTACLCSLHFPAAPVHVPICVLYLTPRKELFVYIPPSTPSLPPSSVLCLTLIWCGQGCFIAFYLATALPRQAAFFLQHPCESNSSQFTPGGVFSSLNKLSLFFQVTISVELHQPYKIGLEGAGKTADFFYRNWNDLMHGWLVAAPGGSFVTRTTLSLIFFQRKEIQYMYGSRSFRILNIWYQLLTS